MIWHSASSQDVLKSLEVDANSGLANGVVDDRLQVYGQNTISRTRKISLLKRFLAQFKSKTVIFLIVISLISFVVSTIYSIENSISSLLIIAILVFNAFVSAFHLFSCDNALSDIENATNPTVKVLRDGIIKNITSAQLVPGDIILLEEGDYITADARLIESYELRINESALTGEEVPVEKDAGDILEDIVPFEKRSNMVYSGTTVIHGSAKAVVVATALNTETGKTTTIIEQQGGKKLPIESEIDVIGKVVNTVILVVCILVFIFSMLQNFTSSQPFVLITLNSVLSSLALAVATMPKGLPAIAIIVIAIGTQRILKDKIVIKQTNALETIGKTNVICSDKTGIFTHKDMTLVKVFDGKNIVELGTDLLDENSSLVLKLGAVCSTLQNDATEDAIKQACMRYNSMSESDIKNLMPKISEISFDSVRKSMSVITMINERPFAIVKGAPEVIIPKCNNCKVQEFLKLNEDLANEAYRVVALAMRPLNEIPANPQAEEIETNLTFVGLLVLVEPFRNSIIKDIEVCNKAGIKTIMVTGDNLLTAKAVAKKMGLLTDDAEAITGAQLSLMSDEELAQNINNYRLFARILPEDKVRIVKAWQSNGKVVTITGDSLQDAEALSLADVGCAIGKYGTDVAKGNADIIILNNSFGSIVRALKESRGLFCNIKKAVYYLCSCNIAELLLIFIGSFIFKTPILASVQLLLINLLTDCAPAISFSMEKAEDSVMEHKSFSSVSKILNLKMVVLILIQSLFIAIISLISYIIGYDSSVAVASTMAFVTLGISQGLHCFNCKLEDSIFNKKVFSNSFMNKSIFVTLFITVFLAVTPIGFVFGLTILNNIQLLIASLLAFLIVPLSELFKYIKKKI